MPFCAYIAPTNIHIAATISAVQISVCFFFYCGSYSSIPDVVEKYIWNQLLSNRAKYPPFGDILQFWGPQNCIIHADQEFWQF